MKTSLHSVSKLSFARLTRIFLIVMANTQLGRLLIPPVLIGIGCCIPAGFAKLAEGSFVLPLLVGGGLGLLGYIGSRMFYHMSGEGKLLFIIFFLPHSSLGAVYLCTDLALSDKPLVEPGQVIWGGLGFVWFAAVCVWERILVKIRQDSFVSSDSCHSSPLKIGVHSQFDEPLTLPSAVPSKISKTR